MARSLRRFLIAGLVAVLLGAAGVWSWRHRVLDRQESMAGPAIEKSLKAGDFLGARAVLKRVSDPLKRADWEHKIRGGELEQGLKVRDVDMLQLALGDDGAPWLEAAQRERAALVLARHAVQAGDRARYDALAAPWKESKTLEGQWFLLEADRLIGEKQRDEAKAWLDGRKLAGREEAQRQARLALLDAKDPVAAWKSIEAGLSADPRNADLLSFRGQLLEALGRREDARFSYVMAIVAEPDNPLHRDTLANFYRRLGRLPEAVDTWREAAQQTGLGVYGFKAWFWGRVSGHEVHKALPACKQVGWNEVIPLLGDLQTGPFTSSELQSALRRLPGKSARPEMEWMTWLEALRSGDLAKVDETSGLSKEARALWPGLAERVKACAAASHGRDPRVAIAGADKVKPSGDEHSFVHAFQTWSSGGMSEEEQKAFEVSLARPDSVIGALLASGWAGAALDLAGGATYTLEAGAPEWLGYGYAKSLQERDGVSVARAWLEKAPGRTPASDLLLGELRVADKAVDEGIKLIAQVASGKSEHAGRARWTLAMIALEKGDGPGARAAVEGDAELAASPRGAEILARAALLEGKRDEATAIYRKISPESADALIFLSKEAFAAAHYDEAEDLTRKLVDRFPEELKFRQNLQKIQELRTKPAR